MQVHCREHGCKPAAQGASLGPIARAGRAHVDERMANPGALQPHCPSTRVTWEDAGCRRDDFRELVLGHIHLRKAQELNFMETPLRSED